MSPGSSQYTFGKEERLCRKKVIDNLFSNGKSFYSNPFRVIYVKEGIENAFPAQVLITISRKAYRNATERNRIRRKIREAYRYSKEEFYLSLQKSGLKCAFVLIFNGNPNLSTDDLRQKINQCLKRLIRELNEQYLS